MTQEEELKFSLEEELYQENFREQITMLQYSESVKSFRQEVQVKIQELERILLLSEKYL